jgi:hypothetical protein
MRKRYSNGKKIKSNIVSPKTGRKRYSHGTKIKPNIVRTETGRVAYADGDEVEKTDEEKWADYKGPTNFGGIFGGVAKVSPEAIAAAQAAQAEAAKGGSPYTGEKLDDKGNQKDTRDAGSGGGGGPSADAKGGSGGNSKNGNDDSSENGNDDSGGNGNDDSGGNGDDDKTVESPPEEEKKGPPKGREDPDPTEEAPFSGQTEATQSSAAQREREFRAAASAERMEKMAAGTYTLADINAEGKAVKLRKAEGEEDPKEFLDSAKADYKVAVGTERDLDETAYDVSTKDEDLKEAVDTITTAELGKADAATTVTASTFTADTVPEDVIIAAAQGTLSDESKISEDLGVDRVPKIDPADVTIETGSITQRVVGELSEESFAKAVKVAGISLPRVTRAKQQLSNAGVSDEAINLLGNDPDELEAELMNYSEKERGIISGLPPEALVSTQMNALFEGMQEGEIPLWAKPATDKIDAILAVRGLSASSVGRDALTSVLVSEAFKIADSNAKAIQASVAQGKGIEAQALLREAEFAQQTGITNAQNVFKMDMAQFSVDQQTALSNSKFMQTVSLTNAGATQQAIMQDAVMLSQVNLAEADFTTKLRVENAKHFLNMDMANLSNRQQAVVLDSQQEQQRMLSNQAAVNASKQFNSTSENQTNQYMAGLKDSISKFNAQQTNAAEQFNAAQTNAAQARFFGRKAEADKFNQQIAASVDQFNEQNAFAREQFNAQNALVIDQSNAQWRRDINKIDTAAQNAMNARNAQNSFAMTQSAQAQLWQEMRDEFDYIWKSSENAANRETNIAVAGISGENSALTDSGAMGKLRDLINLLP